MVVSYDSYQHESPHPLSHPGNYSFNQFPHVDKMKNIIILFFTLFLPVVGSAQAMEASIWYFGENAGLSFQSDYPTALTNGALNTKEGCASICNYEGQLQFYTDGCSVYNRNHRKMPNGFGLKGHYSASQSATIVPKPGSRTEYYIFTVACMEENLADGLCYSLVDMTLDNGLGDIVPGEKNIQIVPYTCEKVTAIEHNDCQSFWVITKMFGNSEFRSYRVSNEGVDLNPIISTTGTPVNDLTYSQGCLKVSHDGKWLVSVDNELGVDFHHFDNSNGLLTHVLSFTSALNLVGVEFSPNNTLVYISESEDNTPNIYQYDLSSDDPTTILNSRIALKHNIPAGFEPVCLQLGPDNRIYVGLFGSEFLARINKPDLSGNRCDLEEYAVYLKGRKCLTGLPNFTQSFFHPIDFTAAPNCSVGPTSFLIADSTACVYSVKWEFNDAGNYPYDTSTLLNPSYQFSHADTFYVKLTAWSELGIKITIDTVIIHQSPFANFPATNPTQDTIFFENVFLLEATPGYASYEWNTGDNINYINVTQEGKYTVTMLTEEGCQVTESVSLLDAFVAVEVPNAFTSNGDGLNDNFRPVVKTEFVRQFRMSVYNHWGQLLFETHDAANGWDGAGTMPGVYTWVIEYTNRVGKVSKLKGSVVLVK